MPMRLAATVAASFISLTSLTVASPPDRDAYIQKLDPICQETNRKVTRALRGFDDALGEQNHNHDRAARLLDRAVEIYAKSVRRIGTINPPSGDADLIAKWLRLEHRDIAVTRGMVRALHSDRVSHYNRLVDKSLALERRINRTIDTFGFKHCN